MATVTRTCEICGKEYPYCKTFREVKFRWQNVACCPEHGFEFFKRVMESRGQSTEALEKAYPGFAAKPQETAEEIPDDEQDEDELLDEEEEFFED